MNRKRAFLNAVLDRLVLAALIMGIGVASAFAAPQMLPPITPAERALKECPAVPGAPAVILFHGQTSNHENWTFSESYRIKVLTPAGKDYGSVEIPYSDAWEIEGIRASVMKPDGRIATFSGPFLDKTVVAVGRFKHMIRSFALPEIEVGSIIDYVYDLRLNPKAGGRGRSLRLESWKPEEGGDPDARSLQSYTVERWDLSAPLFTYKAHFRYIPMNSGNPATVNGKTILRLAWVSYGLASGPPVLDGGQIDLEVENIPAREKEESESPEDEGRMDVIFFYCATDILRAEDYWTLEGEAWQKAAQKFAQASDPVRTEARTLVAAAPTPMARLKALYDRAQVLKNLSYDREMTPEKRRELKLRDNKSAADTLKRRAGLRSDITRTFVALARAAGFRAEVARVVTRDDKAFHKNILDLYGQFDSEMAVVEVDGKEVFCDPATPGCPLGLVRWNCTDTTYLRTSSPPGTFFTTPADPPERTSVRRSYDLRLDASGGLSGTAILTCTGHEALEVRLAYLGQTEDERDKALGQKMAALIPEGGRAEVRNVVNLSGSADELRIEYNIAWPGAATPAGDRLILPVVPYQASWRNSFRHARRNGPVCFPYTASETDDIVVALPAGMSVETVPAAAGSERQFARYTLSARAGEGSTLRVHREITIRALRVEAVQYPVLKSFFDQVRAGDEGQVVLAAGKK